MKIYDELAAVITDDEMVGGLSPARSDCDRANAVIYARYTTQRGIHAPPDRQVGILDAHAEAKGIRIIGIYVDRERRGLAGGRDKGLPRMIPKAGVA